MPPRRTQGGATQAPAAQATQGGNDDAGGSQRATIPEYVPFTLAQAIMGEGSIPEKDVKAMVRRLMKMNTDDAFLPVLNKIQKDVAWLEIGIERIKLPMNNEWYICSVNKEKDDASKTMGSNFSIEQMDYFRAVVDKIGTEAPRDEALIADVSGLVLKNVEPLPPQASSAAAGATQTAAAKRQKMSMVDREHTLRVLAAQGWLFESRAGYYTLGPRTLGELKELVLSTLPTDVAEKLQSEYM